MPRWTLRCVRPTCVVLLALFALLIAGCTDRCPAPDPTAACNGRRWIGILDEPTDGCPVKLTYWTSRKLFKGDQLPDELARYCVFGWNGKHVDENVCPAHGDGNPGNAEIAELTSLPGVTHVDPDCADVAQLAFEDDLQSWEHDEFLAHAGGVSTLPAVSGALPSPRVRLIVADTAPDALSGGGIPIGRSRHGDTLANLARNLACPGGQGCATQLATALALPRKDLDELSNLDPPDPKGGYFGTEGDVAEAIWRAIAQWRDDVFLANGERPVPPRLVLNLSLGWEQDTTSERDNCIVPGALTPMPEDLDSPARAAYDALRVAVCHGALVLGAAGNDVGGPEPPTGLVCPARWEELAAPDTATCAKLVGDDFAKVYTSFSLRPVAYAGYDKLIHAVGGVDYADTPLVPERPGARPRLAALGLAATAGDLQSTQPPALTGSSVPTAVVSAVVAATWGYKPEMTAPEVMELVYKTGRDLQVHASPNACFNTGSTPGPCGIRRVSICGMLVHTGLLAAGACKEDPLFTQNHPLDAPLEDAMLSQFGTIPTQTVALSSSVTPPHDYAASVGRGPGALPEPNWPACPACALLVDPGASNAVFFYDDSGLTLTSAVLVLETSNGSRQSAPLGTLSGAAPMGFSMALPPSFTLRSAWFSGILDDANGDARSLNQQILITGGP